MTDKDIMIISPDGQSLVAQTPAPTWGALLEAVGIDENFEGADLNTIPAAWVEKVPADGIIPDKMYERILRERVTPQMRAAITVEQKRVLDAIGADIKKSNNPADALSSESIGARVATLLVVDRVPHQLVLDTVTDAAMRGHHSDPRREKISFALMYEFACATVEDFRDEPARTFFNNDEYSRMAELMHKNMPNLTAVDARRFFKGDRPLPTSWVDVAIQFYLARCTIWDTGRNQQTDIGLKLVAEVRGAWARKYPRLASTEAGEVARATLTLPSASPACEELFVLLPERFTPSETLWNSYLAFCAPCGVAPVARGAFFKALGQWARGRVRATKRGTPRVPGYLGVALR